MVAFERESRAGSPDYRSAAAAVTAHWRNYWTERRRDRFLGQHRPARRRARAPHRPFPVSGGDQPGRRGAAAGRGPVLEQLERQVPPRGPPDPRRPFRRLGPARPARAQPRLVPRRTAPRPRRGGRARRRGRLVDQDGGAGGTQQPVDDQSLHHVAAAGADLHGRAGLARPPRPRNARPLWRAGRPDRAPAGELAPLGRSRPALRARPADHSRPGEPSAADDGQSRLRARVLPLGPDHGPGCGASGAACRGTRPGTG